jgi:hypothetical protein
MKTLHITNPKNRTRERVRLGMTFAGIATAIICSAALLYETPFMQREVSRPKLIETPKIVGVDLPVEVVSSVSAVAIWPF